VEEEIDYHLAVIWHHCKRISPGALLYSALEVGWLGFFVILKVLGFVQTERERERERERESACLAAEMRMLLFFSFVSEGGEGVFRFPT
jgi:hypothetical protein